LLNLLYKTLYKQFQERVQFLAITTNVSKFKTKR